MYITSISLSYALLGATIIACGFFIYFKTLVIKTGDTKETKNKILGKMKEPEAWRNKNNKMSYVSLFWTIVSLLLFIYLKFFYTANLVSILYIFAYIALIVITTALTGVKNKASI
jgi:hypothetical protein